MTHPWGIVPHVPDDPGAVRGPGPPIGAHTDEVMRELERRERLYRGNRPFPALKDRIVILVDDGLATGSTMRAAVLAVRRLVPAEIIVAVPVGAGRPERVAAGSAPQIQCGARRERRRDLGRLAGLALGLVNAGLVAFSRNILHAALGRYLWFSGDGASALAACREAVRLVPAQPPSVERARVTAGLAQILMILTHSEEAVMYARQAVDLASAIGARATMGHALNTLGLLTAHRAGEARKRRSVPVADGYAVPGGDLLVRRFPRIRRGEHRRRRAERRPRRAADECHGDRRSRRLRVSPCGVDAPR